jgi:hypothetical protein
MLTHKVKVKRTIQRHKRTIKRTRNLKVGLGELVYEEN